MHKSYPSSIQLSIIAMEELGKAKELENYYFHQSVEGLPLSTDEEDNYFKLYYSHTWKQGAAIDSGMFEYSPKFVKFVEDSKLETTKQISTYVGLDKVKGKANYAGRVRSPFTITEKKAKQQISLINDILLEMCDLNVRQEGYFWIDQMDKLIDKIMYKRLKTIWKSRSGIKSRRWSKIWVKRLS
jgi:AbiV family abortive infection protein